MSRRTVGWLPADCWAKTPSDAPHLAVERSVSLLAHLLISVPVALAVSLLCPPKAFHRVSLKLPFPLHSPRMTLHRHPHPLDPPSAVVRGGRDLRRCERTNATVDHPLDPPNRLKKIALALRKTLAVRGAWVDQ